MEYHLETCRVQASGSVAVLDQGKAFKFFFRNKLYSDAFPSFPFPFSFLLGVFFGFLA
jgi:hypothetical protein